MAELPWNKDIMEFIFEHRNPILDPIFFFFTMIGELNGYIMIVSALYVMYDKKIGYRLALVAATSATFNHLLKIIIRNPRPFVTDGSYRDKWSSYVPNPETTVTEFSTPSGHAMGSASFYGYLHAKFSDKRLKSLFIFLIIMIGLSRPYLGVHYVEDVVIGWLLGIVIVYAILKFEDKLDNIWASINLRKKSIFIVVTSVIVWVIAGLIVNWGLDGNTFATNAGFLTGFVIGRELELKNIKFDPKSSAIYIKIIRFILTVILVIGMLAILDIIFGKISGDDSFLGFLLRYIRYCITGFTAIYLAPLFFIKTKLAKSI